MRKMLLTAALCGMSLVGCAKTVNTVNVSADGQYNWIQTDPTLNKVASLTRVSKARADGLLRVQVDVTNLKSSERVIQYRFVWLDKDNMQVATPMSTWQRAFLTGKQTVSLQGIAPTEAVTDCRLEMVRVDK